LAGDKKDRILTKQRLMLSAAMAAILASAAHGPARADVDITSENKSAQTTATDGNITIETGGQINIKSSAPAVTINSNNSLTNIGTISNTGTSNATGILIDTSAGNLVASGGIYNVGGLGLGGDGKGKAALAVFGGNTYFGPITFSEVAQTSTVGTTTSSSTVTTSSIAVQGDQSYVFYLAQGTTIDGNVSFGGPISLVTSKNSSVAGATAMELDGNLQGNLVFDNATNLTNVAKQARGVVVLGPITPCLNSGSYTCATASTAIVGGTTLGNVGAFVNNGAITVLGTTNPSTKSKDVNPESGSAVIIANSIAGGFLNNGPATANSSIVTASIIGNGATVGGIAYPVFLIDPAQSITATNATIRGPVILGAVPLSIDSVDGAGTGAGFGFINRGTIRAAAESPDVSTTTLIINGSSPINNTIIRGGLLNTGTISASAGTSVNTNSGTTANAVTIGSYVTIPRIVVSGEVTSAATTTAGAISAQVSGLGGGAATGLGILSSSSVPEIDVLQHGSISATISTSTLAPTSDFATAKTPFVQTSIAIVDASGTVKKINNAGTIVAQVTQLNPGANAVISSATRAIDLLAGTGGFTTINNSGNIQGDIFFNSGGGGNTLNVGNTGAGTGDGTGNANAAIATAQGTPVTDTPFLYATVSGIVLANNTGFAPTTYASLLSFGSGVNNVLHVGGFGYVNAVISSAAGGLDIQVDNNGLLYIANTQASGSVNVRNLNVGGGILGLTISQNSSSTTPVILASGPATIASTAQIGLQFGSFISSGTTAASTGKPTKQVITLISAPSIIDAGITNQNISLSKAIPFLFESPTESAAVPIPLALGTNGVNQTLTLTLLPRSTGKTNADGTAGLNLSGAALKLFPNTAAALGNDPELGTQIASSLTVYNNANGVSSGINIAASQAQAQQVFSEFAPDVSGGGRQVAILITDQATGPVAARQRLLRSYAAGTGEMTLWGEEFAGMINNKGRFDGEGDLTTFKDHGFGFSLGMDAGSARSGWYGGALTFYSSDVIETLPRQSKTNLQWYMLTGYTDWHGNHVFFDTKLDVGYGNLDGQRSLIIGNVGRVAEGKRASLLGALGGTTGVFLKYAGIDLTPHISLDGLTMREEGYTEAGGGDGFNLQVAPYYANSLRTFLGVDAKKTFDLFGANVSPEARLGYRYDFISAPVKLKAAFASTGGLNSPGNSFTFVGPDPDTSNAVAGFSLGTGTDAWNLGINYDWVRGNNASTTQIGTITLLGRI
jgi:hypothetical protein